MIITTEAMSKTTNVPKTSDTVPVSEKYALSIREAAAYYNVGIKKLRRMAEDNLGRFAVYNGNRFLIIREKFEKYLESTTTI